MHASIVVIQSRFALIVLTREPQVVDERSKPSRVLIRCYDAEGVRVPAPLFSDWPSRSCRNAALSCSAAVLCTSLWCRSPGMRLTPALARPRRVRCPSCPMTRTRASAGFASAAHVVPRGSGRLDIGRGVQNRKFCPQPPWTALRRPGKGFGVPALLDDMRRPLRFVAATVD